MSILESLYQGNINPWEAVVQKGDEYDEQNQLLAGQLDQLLPTLNQNQVDLCQTIGDTIAGLWGIAQKERFIQGFCMDARMMLEIMDRDGSDLL